MVLEDEDFVWYTDADGDGVGVTTTAQLSCTPIPGAVLVSGDRNDADPNLTTVGAACDDGDPLTFNDIVRPNCSCLGFVQGSCPPSEIPDCNGNCAPVEWIGDGFCDDGSFEHNGVAIFLNCPEYGNDGGDCGSGCTTEVCDGIDNDCDGLVDEDFPQQYADNDGDGFGDLLQPLPCDTPGVANATDRNDNDPSLQAGIRLAVLTDNPTDVGSAHYIVQHAGGIIEGDLDLPAETEGVGEIDLCLATGCFSISIQQNDVPLYFETYLQHPGSNGEYAAFPTTDVFQGGAAPEVCDGIDNDRDGLVDEGFPQQYADSDGDGFGDLSQPLPCGTPGVANTDDRDDTAAIFLGAAEICDGMDNNCDGSVDEGGVCADDIYDGIDNDGDGLTDAADPDLVLVFCENQIGVCSGAIKNADRCVNGIWEPCVSEDYLQNSPQYLSGGDVCDGLDNDCDGHVDESCVLVSVRAFLEGPYDTAIGTMNDGMRALGLVLTTEPYARLGYTHVGGGESTSPAVLAITDDAIVDRVLLELRCSADASVVLATRSALLQCDGDIVATDGVSALTFNQAPAAYHVALRHRNHLGVMTGNATAFGLSTTPLDLASASTGTFGTSARKSLTGTFPVQALWAGDVTFDGTLRYTGQDNDRDPVLARIGGTLPTNTTNGYFAEDVDLNGQVKYTGSGNDRDPILQNIGGSVPTNTRVEQLPTP